MDQFGLESRHREVDKIVKIQRPLVVAVLVSLLWLLSGSGSGSAFAGFNGDTAQGGVGTIGWSAEQRAALKAKQAEYLARGGPRYEFKYSITNCDVGGGGNLNRACYNQAVRSCANNKPEFGSGPLTDIAARLVNKDGEVLLNGKKATPAQLAATPDKGFVVLGVTCFPDDMPGSAPIPSVAMISKAFHLTRWSKGGISTQPKGNVTLVNLKTFYQVDWSAAGFEPGEIDALDPATMFGFKVDVRPKLESFVYHFGDGASEGPTTSSGGVYPDGDIVHTYTQPGKYQTYVEATFGADFRIAGGAWLNLPDTVVVRQPSTPVTVREARAVLVQQ